MRTGWINNFRDLAVSANREKILQVVEAGYDAIDTKRVVYSSISLSDHTLRVKDREYKLDRFKNIKLLGFGKAACLAAAAVEKIIGPLLTDGVVISAGEAPCKFIKTYKGTHPEPSETNVEASKKVLALAEAATEDDLVIVIVSGGGSALLCWPEDEYKQGQRLYNAFLKSGGTIEELNIVRKHISLLKGGGLARALYPATVVGLIFSDVPGANYKMIASGPTFKSASTIADARRIIEKYKLGEYRLIKNPGDDKYFKKVDNILLVSNETALQAMKWRAGELGFEAKIVSAEIYESPAAAMKMFLKESRAGTFIIGGGEPRLAVDAGNKAGGRNLFFSLTALRYIKSNQVFISFASDGRDNSDFAGGIADAITLEKAKKMNLDIEDYIKSYDALTFFKKTGNTIDTGPTGANVSDLMVLFEQ